SMQESIRQASDTFLAIGPSCEVCNQAMLRLLLAISPGEGRNPTTPQNAAGFLTDPPVSEPVASGTMPVASATADPPDEPAAERSGSNGLPVAPCSALRVLPPAPHSGTLVLPTTIAPACLSIATIASSSAAMLSANSTLPKLVGSPLASIRSLTPSGSPCSGPSASPRITAASLCRAVACRFERARADGV